MAVVTAVLILKKYLNFKGYSTELIAIGIYTNHIVVIPAGRATRGLAGIQECEKSGRNKAFQA